MATTWDKSTFKELSTINNNYELENGDIIQPNPINAAIENTGYLKDEQDKIKTNLKIYNHYIKLQFAKEESGSEKYYNVELFLQDNCSESYTLSTLITELQRIEDVGRAGDFHAACFYRISPPSSEEPYNNLGFISIATHQTLFNVNGDIIADTFSGDTIRLVEDRVTIARQNS